METHPIILALEEQLACYRRLTRLVEAQHEHVQQMHMEGLLEVLRARQEVLDRLKVLQPAIGPAQRRWSEIAGDVSPEERARGEAVVGETRRLLEQITAADRDDALPLQQRKLSVGKEIKQASAARQINRTYAAAAYGSRTARVDVQR